MRILVCGGRDYNNKDKVYNTLGNICKREDLVEESPCGGFIGPSQKLEIISGMANGADKLGADFAEHHNLKLHKFPADWKTHGRSAGPIRNNKMLKEGKPDLVVAFPGGKGTAHMIRIARKANVEVIEVGTK